MIYQQANQRFLINKVKEQKKTNKIPTIFNILQKTAMQTSKGTSNSICQPQSKENILNFIWLDKTTDNSIVIEKICERNLCSVEEAQLQLKEYHKFLYCLGKEFRLNELLQDQMLLFPSAIISRIWRMHQLFTIEYPSLCRDLGFNFISFNPEKICFWSQTENQINKLRSTYEKTLESLKQEFKEELNEEIWPSNFDDMVKQHLLSFHINLTTFKAIENTVNNLNGAINFSKMSISDIKNKIIPEIRKDLHQFKETTFELVNQDSQDQRTKEIYQKMNNLVFPQEMVSHIQNEYLLTPESTQYLIMEYKKFFMIFLVNNSFSQVPSAFVDEVWHTHINFAKIYSYSCKVLTGGFINHVPATNLRENEQEIMKEEFNQTMALYEKLFGPVNEQYWQLKGEFRDDQQNFFWIDLYNLNKKSQQVECQDSLNVKEQETQDLDVSISTQPASVNQDDQKNSCSNCIGDCFARTIQNKNMKNSCDGCDGSCNANGTGTGTTQNKKQTNSCSGCDGTCNANGTGTGTTQNKKLKNSCDGCDGTCNANGTGTGTTQNKKQANSCSGCDGTCNANGTGTGKTQNNMLKNSCDGCDGTCNANGTGTGTTENKKQTNSCSGCDGTCNANGTGTGTTQYNSIIQKNFYCYIILFNLQLELKNSCDGCDGTCNANELKNSCSGCDGTCNANGTGTGTTQNNSIILKNFYYNIILFNQQLELKNSCDGCDGTCNANGTGTTQSKKQANSCSGCDGNCNANGTGTGTGKTQNNSIIQKRFYHDIILYNLQLELKNSCDGCDGTCNTNGTGTGTTQNKMQTNSCSGCDGTCNANGTGTTGTTKNNSIVQIKFNCCIMLYNLQLEMKNSCDGCDGTCNTNGTGTGTTQNKKQTNSCSGCDGTCNANGTVQTNSCSGCDGTCNANGTGTTGTTKNNSIVQIKFNCCIMLYNLQLEMKNSCDGCDGTCNTNGTEQANSCSGCDGTCNANGTGTGSTQNKSIIQKRFNHYIMLYINLQLELKNSCDGCDGTCNTNELKNSCDGCDGTCNTNGTVTTQNKILLEQTESCSGCDGTCNTNGTGTGTTQNKKMKNSCDGCDGTSNTKTQSDNKKNSCDGCDGTNNNAKKAGCTGCDGDCFAKYTTEKKDMKWCFDCLGSENKNKNQIHSTKMKIQQQQKMIQLCGICFSVNEQALNRSQLSLAKLWCTAQQNNQEGQEESQNKKTDVLELVQGMNRVIVQ
ncbi:hypothetical protein ABPG74_012758 [Tetrahymena malaccensis]